MGPWPMVLKKPKNQVIEATRQLFEKTCLFFPKIQNLEPMIIFYSEIVFKSWNKGALYSNRYLELEVITKLKKTTQHL